MRLAILKRPASDNNHEEDNERAALTHVAESLAAGASTVLGRKLLAARATWPGTSSIVIGPTYGLTRLRLTGQNAAP